MKKLTILLPVLLIAALVAAGLPTAQAAPLGDSTTWLATGIEIMNDFYTFTWNNISLQVNENDFLIFSEAEGREGGGFLATFTDIPENHTGEERYKIRFLSNTTKEISIVCVDNENEELVIITTANSSETEQEIDGQIPLACISQTEQIQLGVLDENIGDEGNTLLVDQLIIYEEDATPTPTTTVTTTPEITTTVTPTTTGTPIPWYFPAEITYYDIFTCPDPLSNLYSQDENTFNCYENEVTPGFGYIYFIFSDVPSDVLSAEFRFKGHYNGDHIVTLGCVNIATETEYPIQILQTGQGSDEIIINDFPESCYDAENKLVAAYIKHDGEVGNTAHTLIIDELRINVDNGTTPTPTPTLDPSILNIQPTSTYGEIANFGALMLIAAVMSLSLIYNVVSSIVFRKRN